MTTQHDRDVDTGLGAVDAVVADKFGPDGI